MTSQQRTDDATIPDHEKLWRRINPKNIVKDKWTHAWRPMSGAFMDRNTGEMSVDLASLTTIATILAEHPDDSIAEFTAGEVRLMGYNVVRDPLPDNPAHALVSPRLTAAHARKLASKEPIWVRLNPTREMNELEP